jgi:general stress protein 26
VQLFYANSERPEYLSVFVKASIILDKNKAKKLWTPLLKAWFTDGVDDPQLALIKIEPTHSYYWDTKSNKMIAMLKILTSVVTGKTTDDSLEGKLKV